MICIEFLKGPPSNTVLNFKKKKDIKIKLNQLYTVKFKTCSKCIFNILKSHLLEILFHVQI